MFGFTFAPTGWALCNGQLLAISQNTALFSLLGTSYGGDGRATFALPNLQGRVAVHQGNGAGLSPYVLGEYGGAETVELSVANLAAHTHTTNSVALSNPSSPPASVVALTPANPQSNPGFPAPVANAAVNVVGTGTPFGIVQPFLTVIFCIAMSGIFPSRN
jgi:microcystin-dependent protein